MIFLTGGPPTGAIEFMMAMFLLLVVGVGLTSFIAFRRSDYYRTQFQKEHIVVKVIVILMATGLIFGTCCALFYGCLHVPIKV
ncbi:hypothetical protein SD10_08490 [Spirosoma radiotolerans]|uniref:Uncharacterized protein n=1 Tax=Spirosoma radiotolerans TaxID=1379870 RepID=A0A0E3ZV58_9BACT|nr:hypothetical protein SD10_08490 [Spirosoma radiotolerans]